ncbi:acyl-CoA dehydrogenase family protein, partial [Aduncisulcus paluster]
MSELFPAYHASWETDAHRDLRKHAAEFFRKESTPNQERWSAQHQVDREFWNKLGDAGLLGLDLPEEYGGAGGDFGFSAVVAEELALAQDTATGWGVHSPIVAHYINTYGNAEQKGRWMPGIISGDLGAKGISLIVAETKDLPGFERGRVLEKVGQHGQDTRELFFTDMRVPVANRLGEEDGQGFFQLMTQLARERLIIASGNAGMAEAAVLESIKYTKEREAFGKPLIKFQNTKFQLAELKAEVLSIKTTVDWCIQNYIDGNNDPATASI